MSIRKNPQLLVALAVSLLTLIVAMAQIFTQWPYSEAGHGYIVIGLLAECGILFALVFFKRYVPAFVIFMLIVSTVIYANIKFEWRRDYITSAQRGDYFVLSPYIDSYPTFEEHVLADFMDKPRWIAFANDCVNPGLKGEPVSAKCRTQSSIQTNYNVNVMQLINAHHAKMRRTAERVQQGEFNTKQAFSGCLKSKQCAMIPLLPESVNMDQFDEKSDQYIDIRRSFWTLVNTDQLTPGICDFFDLCKAMKSSGVVTVEMPTEEPADN